MASDSCSTSPSSSIDGMWPLGLTFRNSGDLVCTTPAGGGVGQAVALHDRHVLEGEAELVGEPDVARGAGAVDAVDGQHGATVYQRGVGLSLLARPAASKLFS